ncbi:MAG: DUF4332 domain-containing protein [Fuerstiella sp.]
MMGYKINEIEGIGDVYKGKLLEAEITTTDQLLELCASAKGRKDVAAKTGLTASQLLKWADMADLMRLKGIGRQFGELLKAAGVDTVKELRTRVAANLAAKLKEVNEEKKLAKAIPGESKVQTWIDTAKETEPLISH